MQQWNDFKVHAKNSGNQIQRQKNGSDRGERSHGLVGAIALRIEVNLYGSFNALL